MAERTTKRIAQVVWLLVLFLGAFNLCLTGLVHVTDRPWDETSGEVRFLNSVRLIDFSYLWSRYIEPALSSGDWVGRDYDSSEEIWWVLVAALICLIARNRYHRLGRKLHEATSISAKTRNPQSARPSSNDGDTIAWVRQTGRHQSHGSQPKSIPSRNVTTHSISSPSRLDKPVGIIGTTSGLVASYAVLVYLGIPTGVMLFLFPPVGFVMLGITLWASLSAFKRVSKSTQRGVDALGQHLTSTSPSAPTQSEKQTPPKSSAPDTKETLVQPMKPHFTIGMLGHADSGKTTLLAAISKTLADRGFASFESFNEIELALKEKAYRAASSFLRTEYETENRSYTHEDVPGQKAFVDQVEVAAAGWDGAVVVVQAMEGVFPQTVDHVDAAWRAGVRHFVVVINMLDPENHIENDPDLFELVELESREVFDYLGFPGDAVPVLRLSASRALAGDKGWQAKIMELLAVLDSTIPELSSSVQRREALVMASATDAAWTQLARVGVPKKSDAGPVLLGRELLIQADLQRERGARPEDLRSMLEAAAYVLMEGVVRPSKSEYGGSSDRYAKSDALMWFGIVATLLTGRWGVSPDAVVPNRAHELLGMPDAHALKLACDGFAAEREFTKAGRCAEELAEVALIEGELQDSAQWFDLAVRMFKLGQDEDRASLARRQGQDAQRRQSQFFRGFEGGQTSMTICGSDQYLELRMW